MKSKTLYSYPSNTQKIDLEQLKVKTVNICVFGHGNVGALFIDQIIEAKEVLLHRRQLRINIVAIANSKTIVFNSRGFDAQWRLKKKEQGTSYQLDDVITFANQHGLKNLIAVDNTASASFVINYLPLVNSGFNLVSSNKIANTLSLDFYENLRGQLHKNGKQYLYETNVGAGLPLIDTIKLLHQSGENITRINGVFSGSLSYLFNSFSAANVPFSEVLEEAILEGLTEPDPRQDLNGNDVARKLLILARELELKNEFEQVDIQNLIPADLRTVSSENFLNCLPLLDAEFEHLKKEQKPGHVLRYVGSLYGNLSDDYGGVLEVKLQSVPQQSVLGQLKGSDSIFEIYTQNYVQRPLVIQGAGAGAAVTARGVFGDILRMSSGIN